VAVFHHLPYTNLWCDANGYNGDAWTRGNFVPLFEQYGVDLVVSGHAHAYERGEQNGVTYTVVGGAGGLLDTFVPPETWDFLEVALPVHHYAIMEVEGDRLRWTAYDLDDEVIDAFELLAPVGVPGLGRIGLVVLALGLVAARIWARDRAMSPHGSEPRAE
jgi:hypothetical protein